MLFLELLQEHSFVLLSLVSAFIWVLDDLEGELHPHVVLSDMSS